MPVVIAVILLSKHAMVLYSGLISNATENIMYLISALKERQCSHLYLLLLPRVIAECGVVTANVEWPYMSKVAIIGLQIKGTIRRACVILNHRPVKS